MRDTVKEHCKSLQEPFRPTPWLVLANAQTVVGGKNDCLPVIPFVSMKTTLSAAHARSRIHTSSDWGP